MRDGHVCGKGDLPLALMVLGPCPACTAEREPEETAKRAKALREAVQQWQMTQGEKQMATRAKFTYTGYEATLHHVGCEKNAQGKDDYSKPIKKEMRSLKFSPVFGNGDPQHENTKFWNASPSGQITLGTVNPAAWQQFEIGKEYYVDFTPADV